MENGKREKIRKRLELLSYQSGFGLGWWQWGWREGFESSKCLASVLKLEEWREERNHISACGTTELLSEGSERTLGHY